jgi:hypothetical protein
MSPNPSQGEVPEEAVALVLAEREARDERTKEDWTPLDALRADLAAEGRPSIETLADGRPSGKTWPERLYIVWDSRADRFKASEEDTWLPTYPAAVFVPEERLKEVERQRDEWKARCRREKKLKKKALGAKRHWKGNGRAQAAEATLARVRNLADRTAACGRGVVEEANEFAYVPVSLLKELDAALTQPSSTPLQQEQTVVRDPCDCTHAMVLDNGYCDGCGKQVFKALQQDPEVGEAFGLEQIVVVLEEALGGPQFKHDVRVVYVRMLAKKMVEFDAWLSFRPEFAEVLTAFRSAFGTNTSSAALTQPEADPEVKGCTRCGRPNCEQEREARLEILEAEAESEVDSEVPRCGGSGYLTPQGYGDEGQIPQPCDCPDCQDGDQG